MEDVVSPIIEWGAAGQALAGHMCSGDAYAIVPLEDSVLVAVVDGLATGRKQPRPPK